MPTGQYQHKPRVERVAIVCEVCGQEMLLTPGAIHTRVNANPSGKVRFCSRICMAKAATKPETYLALTCSICGKEYRKRQDQAKRVKASYCSSPCAGKALLIVGAKWRDPQQVKAYLRAYVQQNKDQHNERSHRWTQLNAGKRKEIAARWRESHLDDIRVKSHHRRMSYKGGDLRAEEWAAIKEQFNNCCACCGLPARLTLDHIVPISAGGKHTASNIQPLCQSCNSRKNTKTIDYRQRYPGIKFVIVKA